MIYFVFKSAASIIVQYLKAHAMVKFTLVATIINFLFLPLIYFNFFLAIKNFKAIDVIYLFCFCSIAFYLFMSFKLLTLLKKIKLSSYQYFLDFAYNSLLLFVSLIFLLNYYNLLTKFIVFAMTLLLSSLYIFLNYNKSQKTYNK